MRRTPITELAPRHRAFLERTPVERPLLGIWVGDYYFTTHFPNGVARWRPGDEIVPDSIRFDEFAPDYARLYELHERLDDDFFYVGSAYPGLPWMEAIMGCRVFAEQTSAWAMAFLPSYEGLSALRRPVSESPWFEALMDFTAALMAWADGRFPVNPPLLRGPADIAAAAQGAERMVLDFADHPAEVAELLRICAEARREVVRAIGRLTAGSPWRNEAAGGYPSRLWTPGRSCLYNQEDAAAILSPRIFRKVLLPLEAAIASDAEVAYVHLHSGCLYPAAILAEDPSYAVIQVNYDHAGASPRLAQILPVLQRTIARKPLILWGEFTTDELAELADGLPARGLSLQPISADEDAARELRETVLGMRWEA